SKLADDQASYDAATKGLVPFFQGTGTDSRGRRFEDILNLGNTQMEYSHDFIQWVFPTNELSIFNGCAPLLTKEVQRIFLEDLAIQANLRRILFRFLTFLGLELGGTAGSIVVTRAQHFKT
ncbi:unnamed protein product, partial [Polarella glacialis]